MRYAEADVFDRFFLCCVCKVKSHSHDYSFTGVVSEVHLETSDLQRYHLNKNVKRMAKLNIL